MPLHVALLTHPLFVVRLMGLIHVANEIQLSRPLPAGGDYRLRSWIEGHREADRGHEFELFTALEDGQGTAWHERSTLLARRASTGKQAARSARQTLRYEKPAEADVATRIDIDVPRAIGSTLWVAVGRSQSDPPGRSWRATLRVRPRCRARHVVDGAHARGAWRRTLAPPVHVHVEFKFPLFMPCVAELEHWPRDGRRVFVLKDAESERPHLAGSTRPG